MAIELSVIKNDREADHLWVFDNKGTPAEWYDVGDNAVLLSDRTYSVVALKWEGDGTKRVINVVGHTYLCVGKQDESQTPFSCELERFHSKSPTHEWVDGKSIPIGIVVEIRGASVFCGVDDYRQKSIELIKSAQHTLKKCRPNPDFSHLPNQTGFAYGRISQLRLSHSSIATPGGGGIQETTPWEGFLDSFEEYVAVATTLTGFDEQQFISKLAMMNITGDMIMAELLSKKQSNERDELLNTLEAITGIVITAPAFLAPWNDEKEDSICNPLEVMDTKGDCEDQASKTVAFINTILRTPPKTTTIIGQWVSDCVRRMFKEAHLVIGYAIPPASHPNGEDPYANWIGHAWCSVLLRHDYTTKRHSPGKLNMWSLNNQTRLFLECTYPYLIHPDPSIPHNEYYGGCLTLKKTKTSSFEPPNFLKSKNYKTVAFEANDRNSSVVGIKLADGNIGVGIKTSKYIKGESIKKNILDRREAKIQHNLFGNFILHPSNETKLKAQKTLVDHKFKLDKKMVEMINKKNDKNVKCTTGSVLMSVVDFISNSRDLFDDPMCVLRPIHLPCSNLIIIDYITFPFVSKNHIDLRGRK